MESQMASALLRIDPKGPSAASSPDIVSHTLLVALDGTVHAKGAIELAGWMARARHTQVRILSVVEPLGFGDHPDEALSDTRTVERCAARRRAILEQIEDVEEYNSPWAVNVVPGSVVGVLADASNSSEVDLIIVGAPRGNDAGAAREDTALRLIRRTAKPIVVVSQSLHVPPRVAVAAVDFTRSSLHAARAASCLLAPGGTLFLAHVQPELATSGDGLQSIYAQGMVGAFAQILRELGAPVDVQVKHVLLRGNPRAELLSFCDRVAADLLALGTSRLNCTRLHRARLSSSLVHEGTRSLLIAPAAPASIRPCEFDD